MLIAFASGLWRALSPSLLGRVGALAIAVTGAGGFVTGIFRLDCRGIDAGCENDSWHAQAHKIASGIVSASFLLAPLILALAFRRIPEWREGWPPTLATVPALLLANVVVSVWGDGAATRAGAVVGFIWIAYLALCLLRKGERDEVLAEPASWALTKKVPPRRPERVRARVDEVRSGGSCR